MSFDFDGTGDNLATGTGLSNFDHAQHTIACSAIIDTSQNSLLFSVYNSSSQGPEIHFHSGSARIRFIHHWTTTIGFWRPLNDAAGTGTEYRVAVSYDRTGTAPGNDPTMCINGTTYTVGGANPLEEQFTPAGSVTTTYDRARVGQRTADFDLDGRVWDVAFWSADLTAAELEAYCNGMSPLHIRPESLVLYAPLEEDARDLIRSNDFTAGGNAALSTFHPTPLVMSHSMPNVPHHAGRRLVDNDPLTALTESMLVG